MQSLTPADNTGSRDRRWSSTALSRVSDPSQGRSSHSLSIEDGLENRGASLYEYNSSVGNSSITANPRIANGNDLSSISSLTSFPQAVALTESSPTAVYQTTSPPTTAYDHYSIPLHTNPGSSSSFTFDEVLSNNNDKINSDSDPLDLDPFPQQHPFNMLTGNQPAAAFDQIFPSINYADTLAYPPPCVAVNDERIITEQRTEPMPSSSSLRRRLGPLGVLHTHPFSPQQQEIHTPPTFTTGIHPRSIKRRVIQWDSRSQQYKDFFTE